MVPWKVVLLVNNSLPIDKRLQTHRQGYPGGSYEVFLAPADADLEEAPMNSRPFQQIHCVFCNQPVDLQADLSADENGMVIHEERYVKRITTGKSLAKCKTA